MPIDGLVTAEGDFRGTSLWIAGYREDGKMLSADCLTESGSEAQTDSASDTVKIFWLDEQFAPLRSPLNVGQA